MHRNDKCLCRSMALCISFNIQLMWYTHARRSNGAKRKTNRSSRFRSIFTQSQLAMCGNFSEALSCTWKLDLSNIRQRDSRHSENDEWRNGRFKTVRHRVNGKRQPIGVKMLRARNHQATYKAFMGERSFVRFRCRFGGVEIIGRWRAKSVRKYQWKTEMKNNDREWESGRKREIFEYLSTLSPDMV